nr:MAG TPA: hypothetical protein [Inoviridae sp.]
MVRPISSFSVTSLSSRKLENTGALTLICSTAVPLTFMFLVATCRTKLSYLKPLYSPCLCAQPKTFAFIVVYLTFSKKFVFAGGTTRCIKNKTSPILGGALFCVAKGYILLYNKTI